MISWFKNKYLPDFWIDYKNQFKQKKTSSIESSRFVVFDTETTGLDVANDRILSIGAICITNSIIDVADSFEVYVNQEKFNHETVEIHGILQDGNIIKNSEEEAIEAFLSFIGNGILVAHHAAFDIEMINASLNRIQLPKLKNRSIDTGILYKKLEGKKANHFNLDVLCNEFNIPKHDRHTASGDSFITALLFLKIISKLKQERTVHFSDLFRSTNKKGLL